MYFIYDEDGKHFVVSDKLISFYKSSIYQTTNGQPAIYLDYGEHGEYTAVFKSYEYRDNIFKTLIEMVKKI
jgi:hypothetical protein